MHIYIYRERENDLYPFRSARFGASEDCKAGSRFYIT